MRRKDETIFPGDEYTGIYFSTPIAIFEHLKISTNILLKNGIMNIYHILLKYNVKHSWVFVGHTQLANNPKDIKSH